MENTSFGEMKEEFLSEFRDSLQGESRYMERSFINYLDTEAKKHVITKDDSKVNERTKAKIERMVNRIIEFSDDEKQNILGDEALEELMDISDFAFSIARQTFYKRRLSIWTKKSRY